MAGGTFAESIVVGATQACKVHKVTACLSEMWCALSTAGEGLNHKSQSLLENETPNCRMAEARLKTERP